MSVISELVKELRDLENDPEIDCYGIRELNNVCAKAADTIESLSAKLQAENMEQSAEDCGGGWIPCKDRLPENPTEIVLVCLKNGAVSVAICPIGGEFINMIVGASTQKIRAFPECNPVIAWQPLPEAYHGSLKIHRPRQRPSQALPWCKSHRPHMPESW